MLRAGTLTLAVLCCMLLLWTGIFFTNCTDDDDHDPTPPSQTATPTPPPLPDDIMFTKTYGGPALDQGHFVLALQNGDYLIGCDTQSFGSGLSDIYLVRTDFYGQEIWMWPHTYGGTLNDHCVQIIEQNDGSFLILGNTESFGAGSFDVYLVQVDAEGAYLWSQTYGGPGYDWANTICADGQGNYYIGGQTNSHTDGFCDFLLFKIDAEGNQLWRKTIGGEYGEFCYALDLTADGNILAVGSTYSYGAGNGDCYVFQFDPNGTDIWQRTYGEPVADQAFSVKALSDGGAIICGETWPYLNDVLLFRIDSQGELLWSRTFGGQLYDWGCSVQHTSDNGFIVCGTTNSFGNGDDDLYLIQTDATGSMTRSQTMGGHSSDAGYHLGLALDGGFIVTGTTASSGAGSFDVFLIKTDPNGNTSP
ncbi:hypothetical protein JXQ70_04885 [bacterium]|nr:hypothetical protein [bacterium]